MKSQNFEKSGSKWIDFEDLFGIFEDLRTLEDLVGRRVSLSAVGCGLSAAELLSHPVGRAVTRRAAACFAASGFDDRVRLVWSQLLDSGDELIDRVLVCTVDGPFELRREELDTLVDVELLEESQTIGSAVLVRRKRCSGLA